MSKLTIAVRNFAASLYAEKFVADKNQFLNLTYSHLFEEYSSCMYEAYCCCVEKAVLLQSRKWRKS